MLQKLHCALTQRPRHAFRCGIDTPDTQHIAGRPSPRPSGMWLTAATGPGLGCDELACQPLNHAQRLLIRIGFMRAPSGDELPDNHASAPNLSMGANRCSDLPFLDDAPLHLPERCWWNAGVLLAHSGPGSPCRRVRESM